MTKYQTMHGFSILKERKNNYKRDYPSHMPFTYKLPISVFVFSHNTDDDMFTTVLQDFQRATMKIATVLNL